jgi:hypothetical protein
MDTALALASVISWASTKTAQIQAQDSNGEYFEGFVHASTLIRLGSKSLIRVLQMIHDRCLRNSGSDL